MKKKTKQQDKPKEFSNAPFKGLTGFAAAESVPPAPASGGKAPAPTQPPGPGEGGEDREVFLRYMEGVRKLDGEKPEKRPTKGPSATPARSGEEEERRTFLSALSGMDVTFSDELPDVEPLRPLAANRMRQLKSGAIRIDLELDLHGLTRDEALASLGSFVTGAYNRGQKAILVITGKGNNSPAEPVLQGAVASWLRDAGRKMVAEFAPAPRRMGGSGAFVVFLKDRSKADAAG